MQHQAAKITIRSLSLFLPVWAVIYNLRLETFLGLELMSGTYYGIFLAVALTLVFFTFPAKKKGATLSWYDVILAALSVVPCLYFAWNYENIVLTGAQYTLLDVVLGVVFILVLLEAVRRTTGFFMVVIALLFIAHALFANKMPSLLRAASVPFDRLIVSIYESGSGIFGMVIKVVTTILIAFATFGAMMMTLGAGEKFINLALSLVGHVKGGAAKMALFTTAAMGTMTGDPISNIGISGPFTMPVMKKTGFDPEMSAAVVTAGSVGGVIMPPMMGAVVFIMAEMTCIPYSKLIISAVIPALLFYLAIYCQIEFYSKRNNMVGLPKSEIPNLKDALNKAKFIFIVFGLLVYFLMGAFLYPVRAAYYTLFSMIILFMFDKHSKVTFKKIIDALEIAAKTSLVIVPVAAAAGIILASISMTGWGVRLASNLVQASGGSLFVLALLVSVVSYIMGMGVSALLTYLLLATLVAPAMVQFGVPVVSAHFFIIYMGLSSFFTPPYAVASLQASSLIGADFLKTSFKTMKLSIVTYLVPFAFLYDPIFILEGFTWPKFILAVVTAVIAIYLLSAALEGYFLKRDLLWYERILLGAGSTVLFFPASSVILYIGLSGCLAAIGVILLNSRRMASPR